MKPVRFPTGQRLRRLSGVLPVLRPVLLEEAVAGGDSPLTIVFLNDLKQAAVLADEVDFFAKQCGERRFSLETLLLPEVEPSDDEGENSERVAENELDRLATLSRLSEANTLDPAKERRLVLTTVSAFLSAAPPATSLQASAIQLKRGHEISPAELQRRLLEELHYDAEAVCEYPGQLALRGGLLDVYPFNAEAPIRIDFFGDEVDAIRVFDPSTQRSERELTEIVIAPRPESLSGQAEEGALLEYLPSAVNWIWIEPTTLEASAPRAFEQFERLKDSRPNVAHIFARLPDASDSHLVCSELGESSETFSGRSDSVEECSAKTLELFRERPLQTAFGAERLEMEQAARTRFLEQLATWNAEGEAIVFVAHNEGEAERLRNLLDESLEAAERFAPVFRLGKLSRGFRLEGPTAATLSWSRKFGKKSAALVVVTENEILGRTSQLPGGKPRRRAPMRSRVDQMLDFSELVEGDYLVHLAHGVCIFRGLSRMELGGKTDEVISLEFADSITLHLPLHESHLLTRYLGLAKTAPKLGRLGRNTWDKQRREAEAATLDFAAQLLRLQAARSQGDGHAFALDSSWQRTFEAAFPYQETIDQAAAIEATKKDLASPRPMDRLVCGDVGFGKTEVAIRAAFVAVMDNKQVAILVPTTVLAQQHFNTFRERMAEYPVSVEMISRFRSPAQQKQILKETAEGKIDILVGTHRLLGKDVKFRDLGLLVIDEEHRFGVRHKERMKEMRLDVDVLTMSATPIPRTLYLALMGARDLSTIETPPSNRRPIETIVRQYDPELVRKAIRFELDRGGQAFYLHNRVETIDAVAARLGEMLPDARIAVGHGQMDEDELEDVMTRFVAGEFDLLVCTTIIENGIDIPNCNTIVIEGADKFGLSQLYQLRGRVGRFNRQAYAYLLLHKRTHLKDVARERLSAMRQYNQLGAGFKIAMRDLELRGAGNLLGAEQSGHIAAIGFELYCQLLRQSVSRLKGEPASQHIRATVNLDFVVLGEGGGMQRDRSTDSAFAAIREAELADKRSAVLEASLPHGYVTETRLRIDLYRRLALAETREAVDAIEQEMIDRFGPLPAPVKVLLSLTRIRTLAEAARIVSVSNEGNRLKCLRASGKRDDFVKLGSRFPRLTAEKPLPRLREIEQFLRRNSQQPRT
jgi:transcription-repair coupling factor (superfamily II helicase)